VPSNMTNKELHAEAGEILDLLLPKDMVDFNIKMRVKKKSWQVSIKTGYNLTLKRVKRAIRIAEKTQGMGKHPLVEEKLQSSLPDGISMEELKERALLRVVYRRRSLQDLDCMRDQFLKDSMVFLPSIKVGSVLTGGRTREALSKMVSGKGHRLLDVDLSKYGEGSSSASRRLSWVCRGDSEQRERYLAIESHHTGKDKKLKGQQIGQNYRRGL